ncbi:MAG: DUF4440 domain-containing protein [Thermaurantiacus sp.]
MPAAAADTEALREAIAEIRAAALAGEPSRAAPHMAADLLLVSQSGRLYGREDALLDLGSGIESWIVEAQHIEPDGATARVVATVRRKRKDAEEGRFRVLQFWRAGSDGRWELWAQASVRVMK